MSPQGTSGHDKILIVRPTLKIAGGFISVCSVDESLEETELRKLDVAGAPDHEWPGLFELVAEELAQGNRRLILDLRRVPWMNSRGLGRLIELWQSIGKAGGQVALVCAKGRILTILEISQVSLIMNPVLTVAEAVELLTPPAT